MIIDVEHPESNPWVLTGSTNWSYWGVNYNGENIIFIQSDTIANLYFQEWMERYKEAGGEFAGLLNDDFIDSYRLEISNDIIINESIIMSYLKNNFKYFISDVISLAGQRVASFPLTKVDREVYKAVWSEKGGEGKFPSGIYFLSFRHYKYLKRKVIFLR